MGMYAGAYLFHPNHRTEMIERTIAKHLRNGTVSPEEIALIRGFVAEREAVSNISLPRRLKVVNILLLWRKFINKPYTDLTIGDVYAGINALRNGKNSKNNPLMQNTQHDYVTILKPFLVWLIENGRMDAQTDKIRRIKPLPVDTETDDPADLLSIEEVNALIGAAKNTRDRALLTVLYETGCRIGELAILRWKDLTFDQYGVRVYVHDSKECITRYSRIVLFRDYLTAWRQDYPHEPEGEAPVFLSMAGTPLIYPTVAGLIRRTVRAAGIKKRVTPHKFRKCRATHMIQQGYQESVIKLSLWGNLNTDMFKTYVRLAEKDIDREFLLRAGAVVEEKHAEAPMRITRCNICAAENPPAARYCLKCGLPLSTAAISTQEALKKALWDNPDIMIKYLQEKQTAGNLLKG